MTDRSPDDPTRRAFLAAGATLLASSAVNADDPPLAPPDKQPPDLKLPDPPPKKLGWAVVGLGKLALEEVMPAFAACRQSRPTALVSGHPDKAKRVAAAYGVDPKKIYDYGNYDRIADDPAIDIVYIILPNSMHAEYTVRGLRAGKHVLCEKPMAVTAAECEQMIAAGKDAKRKLMVAYRLRYEPFNQAAIELCRKERAVGAIRTIAASNCQDVTAPNIRLSKALGGGPVEDIGIYCLNAARYLTGEEPAEVTAVAHRPKDDPRFREVPESVAFTLRFPSGVIANCDCSFAAAESRRYRVHGADGFVDMDPAFSYRGLRLSVLKGDRKSELKLTEVNHFAAEMDHFSECVAADRPPRTPGEEGLADVRVIEATAEAARTGRAVAVKR
ncbi:Gfo/Idh/MocA family protein [Gemmata sp.]|uniref:Gfo/Idh/MocA family protein n=1 Tax=Gemmata sp. TaxID=1914242 RepID=UPI003F6F5052